MSEQTQTLKEKIQDQGFIDFEDVKDIKFVSNFDTLADIMNFIKNLALTLGFEYDSFLEFFGLKDKQESKKTTENLEKETNDSIKIENESIKSFDFSSLLSKINIIFLQKNSPFPRDLSKILSKIIKLQGMVKKEKDPNFTLELEQIIFESHFEVQKELLFRSIFGYRDTVKQNFFTTKFLKLAVSLIQERYPMLSGLISEKLNELKN